MPVKLLKSSQSSHLNYTKLALPSNGINSSSLEVLKGEIISLHKPSESICVSLICPTCILHIVCISKTDLRALHQKPIINLVFKMRKWRLMSYIGLGRNEGF